MFFFWWFQHETSFKMLEQRTNCQCVFGLVDIKNNFITYIWMTWGKFEPNMDLQRHWIRILQNDSCALMSGIGNICRQGWRQSQGLAPHIQTDTATETLAGAAAICSWDAGICLDHAVDLGGNKKGQGLAKKEINSKFACAWSQPTSKDTTSPEEPIVSEIKPNF